MDRSKSFICYVRLWKTWWLTLFVRRRRNESKQLPSLRKLTYLLTLPYRLTVNLSK
eukprot:TRINITY_DN3708_c0_g1_i1.p1 TRINITY_DN3708_c0_g1~~TRINITY_DN3708_c0_g1_i1.p1  ORF type:complete len:56 (-),score=1.70 TRINITY_DN3708_c0_g1_i1:247-414(-)